MGFGKNAIPQKADLPVYFDFFYDVWGLRYTLTDIRNAFKLALAKKIDVKEELYGEIFSPQYIARFMDKYDDYKQSLLRTKPEKPIDESHQLPLSKEDQEKKELGIYMVFERHVIEGKKILMDGMYDPVLCYNVLTRSGEILITEMQMKEAEEIVKKLDERSLTLMRAKGKNIYDIRDERNRMNQEGLFDYRVKRYIVQEYWRKKFKL